jgi:hypothetical protein
MVTVLFHDDMSVIRRRNVVEHHQTKAPLGFKEPLNPAVTVLFKFQQEFPFVASLGDVPDLIWDIMSFCPCH